MRAVAGLLGALLASIALVTMLLPARAVGPGNGMIIYSDGSTNEPWVQDWDGATWSAPYKSVDVHEWRTTAGAASRTRDEVIALGLNIHNNIRGEMWNGSTWAEFPFGTLASPNQNYWWSQAVAYERLSDDAVMVWSNGTSSTTPLTYRVWNGTTWSAPATIPVPTSSTARQLQLAASPDSDEMVLVMSDDGSRDYAFVWDGSSWGPAVTLSASGGGDNRTDIAVAYEQQSGDALVTYGRGSSSVLYRTWNGSAWSAESAFAIPTPATGNVRWTTLASDPGSDRIALGVTTSDSHAWLAMWDGSAFGSSAVATLNASGTTYPALDVAFESDSGQAIALYGSIGSSDPRYRTWSGSTWSAEASAFDVGDIPNTIVLDADPYSDQVMATVQDAGSDLSAARWTGSGWTAPLQLEDDTKEVGNQPWVFVWGRYDLPPTFQASALYLDSFNATSLSGSDGTVNWSPTPWVEIGESDGPSAGGVRVGTAVPSSCLGSGGCLGINDQSTGAVGARRTADLDGASVATFSFSYWLEDDGGAQTTFSVQVSASASGPWTTLATYPVTGTSSSPIAASFDITDFASGTTTIRVVSNGTGSSDEIYLDDVSIDASFGLDDRTDVEGAVIDFTLRADDPAGDSLTFAASGLPPGLSIDAGSGRVSGTISQTAAAGSPYSVTMTVSDALGNTDEASFTWTVTGVNVAPVLADLGDQSSNEGQSISFVWSATDADGDDLTWSATGLPTGLSIDPATGLISGTIDFAASGSSPFSVDISVVDDGTPALGDSVTVQWTVADVNRPPAVTPPGDRADAEGSPISFGIAASDPDGHGLTYQAFGLPPGVSIAPSTGVVSGTIGYEAAPGSPFAVLVRVTDDGTPAASTDVTFTWTVTDTNRPPVVTPPADRTDAEATTVGLVVSGTDPDGDGITWSATGLPSGLSVDPGTGFISGTISYAAEGIHPVFVRATDDGTPSGFHEVSFTWTVTNTNRSPVVTPPGDQANGENDTVALAMAGSDPDGDGLTWSVTGLPGGLAIDPVSGVVSGTIDFDSAPGSPYNVTVRATDDDPAAMFDEVSFTWTVTDTNRPPVVTSPGDLAHAEGDPVAFAIVGSDPDGDGLTWSASGLPQGLSIDPASGIISGAIGFDAAASSPHAVTVRATDDGTPSEFDEVAFTWTVADTNRAPVVVNPGNQSDAESDTISLAILGTDPDGDDLTWSATGLPGGLSISPVSGVVSGTLTYTSAGSHSVTVRATDDGTPALYDEVSFSWTVADVNRPPTVSAVADRTDAEGSTVTQAVSGTDPDGDAITWSATGLPPGLSIAPSTGVISGTPTYTASGTYAVTVRATDDGTPVLFSEVAFTWTITNTNRAPIVTNPGPQSGAEASPVTLSVAGSDPDGNTLSWSATGLPPGLSIAPTTGQITGTPSFTAAGTHSVTVRATDDGSPVLFAQVAFSWTIANTNRAPVVINPGTQSTPEGSSPSLQIQASDPDGNLFGFEADGLPPGLTIHPQTGLVTGDLGYDLDLSYTVTVSVTDFGSPPLSTQMTFVWNIGEVNRPPTLQPLSDRSDEQFTSVTIRPTATDPDVGDTFIFTAAGLPGGVSIAPSSGVITGAPNQSGSFTVTVTVTDSGDPALSDDDSFRWTVVSPPGFPVVGSIDNQRSLTGDTVSLRPVGTHPDDLAITWSATGLPDGLTIDPITGRITGVVTAAGKWDVVIQLTDERDQTVAASFSWLVEDPDLPPVASDDTVRAALDKLVGGSVAIDVIGNDFDPEGRPLTLVSAGPSEIGSVRIVDGLVLFDPPNGWLGTVSFTYVVADPAGHEATATVTVTVEEALGTRIAAAALQWDPAAPPAPDPSLLSIDSAVGTDLILGSVVQSLYVLRVPLALLGGAVFWSLLLGGILNLGFVLRGGLPRLVRRTSRNVAVVRVGHGQRLNVLDKPGDGMPIWRFTATERGIEATGRRSERTGASWAEIETPNGLGWVPLANLTEEMDKGGFADDPEPIGMVREFVTRLRARRDFSDLVSMHGLAVAHHGPVVWFDRETVPGLMDDATEYVWKGRNPAYPDQRATFDFAVATGILDAWDHPHRELVHDSPTVPATVMPVEFTNFHMISIGADVHGPERLDQSAWIVVFSHEGGRPRIAGLVKEG